MRLPRVRFTVSQMLVVVAISSAGLGLIRWAREMGRRADRYNDRAGWHRANVGNSNGSLAVLRGRDAGLAAGLARQDAYHAAMAEKWSRAARSPWSPVPSDPPEPPAFADAPVLGTDAPLALPAGESGLPPLPPRP